jgi:integrase
MSKNIGKRDAKRFGFTLKRLRDIEPEDEAQEKRVFIYDTKTDGLRIQITPKGTMTFQFYKWVTGHGAVNITIKRFNQKTLNGKLLKSVVETAETHSAGIAKSGADYIYKLKEKKSESTLDEMFEEWLQGRKEAGMRNFDDMESKYKHHVQPTFGKRKPTSITEEQVKRWRSSLLKKKKLSGKGTLSRTTANRCVELMRAMYNEQLPKKDNPAAAIARYKEESRERYLSGDELAKLFVALDDPSVDLNIKDIVLLALATGARKNNIVSMRWDELNFEQNVWVVPGEKSKNGKPLYIQLLPEAVDVLVGRKKKQKANGVITPFVFAAKRGKSGYVGDPHRYWKAVLKVAAIDETIRFHDLRRTLGSYQAHENVSLHIIGKSLGHSDSKATQIYARIKEANPVRQAMEKGFSAMRTASEEAIKKVVNIKGDK